MQPSLEAQVRIAELRVKAANGELTQEDCKEAITFLRAERIATPPKSSSKAKSPPPDVDKLLGELGI